MSSNTVAHDPSGPTGPPPQLRWGGITQCAAFNAGSTFRAIRSNIGACSSSIG